MSKSTYDIALLDLLPENLRNDPDIIAASKAIDVRFWALAKEVNKVFIFADIDNAESAVVDMLAAEMNLDFYDQNLPLANRRALVKSGYKYKYYKGTALAVKQVVSDIHSAANVEEWFDYGGDPYYFRVTTEANIPDQSVLNNVFDAISKVKNTRSWLKGFAALKHAGLTVYCGMVIHQRKYQRIGI
jgi:phage tail P2-like protein